MVTPEQLWEACERAAAYRRQLALAAGAPAGNLTETIDAVPAYWVERVYPGHWVHAGYVFDTDLSAMLEVRLHPETGRVQVERPLDVDGIPQPTPDHGPPIRYSIWAERGYARPGYVYVYEGREYTPEQAGLLVTEARSDAGRGWRRR